MRPGKGPQGRGTDRLRTDQPTATRLHVAGAHPETLVPAFAPLAACQHAKAIIQGRVHPVRWVGNQACLYGLGTQLIMYMYLRRPATDLPE
jgi:hypothetical protein